MILKLQEVSGAGIVDLRVMNLQTGIETMKVDRIPEKQEDMKRGVGK